MSSDDIEIEMGLVDAVIPEEERVAKHNRYKEYSQVLEYFSAMLDDNPKLTVVRLIGEIINSCNDAGVDHENIVTMTDAEFAELMKAFWRSDRWEDLFAEARIEEVLSGGGEIDISNL